MKKLGIDFKEICKKNPDIVALSLPGFSSMDKKLSHKKATEAIIQAYSGVFSDMGSNRILMGIEPSFIIFTAMLIIWRRNWCIGCNFCITIKRKKPVLVII